MNVEEIAAEIDRALRARADPVRAGNERRYLKSDLVHLGVPVPVIRTIASGAVRAAAPDRAATLALVARLWAATDDGVPVHESRMAAIEVLVRGVRRLEPGDLAVAERLIRDSRTWAFVDVLAPKVVGDLVVRTPELGAELDRFVRDENFWIRRTALLALLPGIRAGAADLDRLSEYGDRLIGETEFFIRKALGWVLRDLGKRDPGWVIAWVGPRIGRISGVTFREAVRHLPAADRTALQAAYGSR